MQFEGFGQRAGGVGRRPALVIVDMNNGFTDPESPLVCELDDTIAAIGRLLEVMRRADLPVVYTTVSYGEGDKVTAKAFIDKVPVLLTLEAGSRWVEIDERLEGRELDREPLPQLRPIVRALGSPLPPGATVQVLPHGLVRREDAGLGPRLDCHVRHREPLVERERFGSRTAKLEHRVRSAADADLREHREDHVLTRHVLPRTAVDLHGDRLRHLLPERAERETGRDVRRAEPGAERSESAVGAGVRVAARDHRAGRDPALLAEERVLDAAATLTVERDALLARPGLEAAL